MAKRDVKKLEESSLESWKQAQSEWGWVAGDRLDALERAHQFLGGDQWPAEDKKRLKQINAGPIVVPELQSHVDAVAGQEATSRFAVSYKPRNPAEPDATWSGMMNEAARGLLQRAEAEHEVSWAYRDCVAAGLGFLTYRFDTERDPEGLLTVRSEVPFQVIYDPYARRQNLTDARWKAVISWVPRDVVHSRWPGAADRPREELDDDNSTAGIIPDVGRVIRSTNGDAYSDKGGPRDSKRKDLKVVHYQFWKFAPFYLWQDPQTGEVRSGTPEQYQAAAERMAATGVPPPPYIVRNAQRAHEAFIAGRTVLQARPCVVNDLPTHALTCFPRKLRDHTEWYGIVDKAKDVQLLMNKLHTLAVHLTAASTKDLVIAEESAFEDWAEAEVAFASPSRILKANPGGVSQNRIMVERAGGLSPIVGQLLDLAGALVPRATGVNLYALGQVDNLSRTSNAAVQSVQRAGQTVLSQPVDALRRFRVRQGRYLAMWVEEMMDPEDLAKYVSPDLVPLIPPKESWPGINRFDVVVDEAPSTPNELERFWGADQHALMQGLFMNPMFQPNPPTLIDMLPPGLPAEMRERWKQDIQMRQQAQAEAPPEEGGEAPPEEEQPNG